MYKGKIYFDITTSIDLDIQAFREISHITPYDTKEKGKPVKLINGKVSPRISPVNYQSYCIEVPSLEKVDECIQLWVKNWGAYQRSLQKLSSLGCVMQLTIEMVISIENVPEMSIKNKHLKILGECGIDLAFDIYEEP